MLFYDYCVAMQEVVMALIEVMKAWFVQGRWNVTVDESAPRKGYPRSLHGSAARGDVMDTCFVDGSARGTLCGVGCYYADGHALNRSAALDVGTSAGANNVAEVAAIFSAVVRHPRHRPLRLFSDSAIALRTIARLRADPRAELNLERPGPALARATVALLTLRRNDTFLGRVAAHADVVGNCVADALASAGATKRADVLAIPSSFYETSTLRTFAATLSLLVAYLRRESGPERSS